MDDPVIPEAVLQFLTENIDSVPHIEALLLLWQDPAHLWTIETIASRIYVAPATAEQILRALQRRCLAIEEHGQYRYAAEWDPDGTLMAEVAATYRKHLVQVTTFIHAGASSSVKEFARAFDLKRGR